MSASPPPLPAEVAGLLDHERDIQPVAAAVRARAIARAQAILTARYVTSSSRLVAAPRIRWAVAAALVCMAGAAVGAGAYEIRARIIDATPAGRPALPSVAIAATRPTSPEPEAPIADAPPAPSDTRATPRLSRADAARAELRLLRQARAAVAREDYAAALPPIADHVRRFKDGRLAEEREALRVKALAGLGRTDDAQRAAAAFRARFPRSVLLSAVGRMPAREP
jgi:hypothetical protein